MTFAPRIHGARGFTLLETLVVLVITSLISVVLVQGFGLVLSARVSVQNKLVDLDKVALERNLFLEPLRGILPDYPDRPNIFAGTARALHGLTTRSLEERAGVPVGFTMSMDYDAQRGVTLLLYQEQAAEPQILGQWEGNIGSFSYRDRTGDWLDAWPPPSDPNATQTPWLVRIDMGTGFPSSLIASIASSHRRPLRFQDIMPNNSPSGR